MRKELNDLEEIFELIDDNIDTLFLVTGQMSAENSKPDSLRDICTSTLNTTAVSLDGHLKDAKALLGKIRKALE